MEKTFLAVSELVLLVSGTIVGYRMAKDGLNKICLAVDNDESVESTMFVESIMGNPSTNYLLRNSRVRDYFNLEQQEDGPLLTLEDNASFTVGGISCLMGMALSDTSGDGAIMGLGATLATRLGLAVGKYLAVRSYCHNV